MIDFEYSLYREGRVKMRRFNKSLLVACFIGGIIGWVISENVYNACKDNWNPVIMTGVYFAILTFCIALPGVFSEWSTNHLSGYAWDGAVVRRTFGFLIIGALVFFLAGALFQFIYGLGKSSDNELKADDYMIIIDNSGSTATTDPYGERFTAVVQFINSLDSSKKVMISIFSDINDVVLPLTQVSKELSTQVDEIFRKYISFGGTDIQNALLKTLQEYPLTDRKAIAILFSDGESDINLTTLTNMYGNADINIYTIGFSMRAYEGKTLLESIADITGGVYYEINEITDFSSALTEITNNTVIRSLLSYRYETEKGSILYIFLRVLFIFIIGMLMGPVFGLIFDSEEILVSNIPIRVGICLSVGIIFEAFLYLGLKDNLLRLFMSVLFSLIFTHYHVSEFNGNFNGSNDKLQNSININRNSGSEISNNHFKKASSDIYTFSNKKEHNKTKNKPKFK